MVFAAALTGIQSASSELAVIGNNIANASTTGFKASRTEFADIYTSSGGSNAIGAGVGISSISQQHSQGSIAFTNSSLDLAISGEGFFMVKDSSSTSYTRAGSFALDKQGFLVNGAGQKLQGLNADTTGNLNPITSDIQISTSSSAPNATNDVNIGLNLDSGSNPPTTSFTGGANPAGSTYQNISSTTVYDSLGNTHVLSSYYIKAETETGRSSDNINNAVIAAEALGGSTPASVETAALAAANAITTNSDSSQIAIDAANAISAAATTAAALGGSTAASVAAAVASATTTAKATTDKVNGSENQWYVSFQIDGQDLYGLPGANNSDNLVAVNFNQNGSFKNIDVPGGVPAGIVSTRTSGLTEVLDTDVLQLTYDPLNGGEMMNFTLNFNNQALGGSTQFGSSFAVQSSDQDGYSTGRIENLEIDTSGIVVGRFSNGQTRNLAQVQLAKFANTGGLQPSGDSSWTESFTSGSPIIGSPGVASTGTLSSGALEQSNVDLTAQLVALITSQRNFQANAQSIRTGDTVSQTIINLR